jgi:hypothetical protein
VRLGGALSALAGLVVAGLAVRWRGRGAALGLALLGIVLAPGAARAALPAPPFALDVAPTRVAAGEAVTLTITPSGGAGEYDLYLMWALVPEAAFLTPAGAWSPQPVPFLARQGAGGQPFRARWTPVPPGDIPLALVVVPAGGDPLARFDWRFRPVVTHLRVRLAGAGAPRDLAALGPVAALALVTSTLVLLAGKPFFD